jgi:hypothetical protein
MLFFVENPHTPTSAPLQAPSHAHRPQPYQNSSYNKSQSAGNVDIILLIRADTWHQAWAHVAACLKHLFPIDIVVFLGIKKAG